MVHAIPPPVRTGSGSKDRRAVPAGFPPSRCRPLSPLPGISLATAYLGRRTPPRQGAPRPLTAHSQPPARIWPFLPGASDDSSQSDPDCRPRCRAVPDLPGELPAATAWRARLCAGAGFDRSARSARAMGQARPVAGDGRARRRRGADAVCRRRPRLFPDRRLDDARGGPARSRAQFMAGRLCDGTRRGAPARAARHVSRSGRLRANVRFGRRRRGAVRAERRSVRTLPLRLRILVRQRAGPLDRHSLLRRLFRPRFDRVGEKAGRRRAVQSRLAASRSLARRAAILLACHAILLGAQSRAGRLGARRLLSGLARRPHSRAADGTCVGRLDLLVALGGARRHSLPRLRFRLGREGRQAAPRRFRGVLRRRRPRRCPCSSISRATAPLWRKAS